MRLSFTLLSTLLFAAPALAQEAAPAISEEAARSVMTHVVDEVIRPGYRDFAAQAGRVQEAMAALCATPSADHLESAKTAFADTARSWARIEIVRVGPVIEDNRFERILYYPDRKGTGLKQTQTLLTQQDPGATQASTLAGKSVGVQGLTALEYVLYGTDAEQLTKSANGFRCLYGQAVATNLQRVAGDLASQWDAPDGIQRAWKTPGPENPLYRNGHEALTEVLGLLVHGTETLRDQRLETFYKGGDNPVYPKQALFWRSGLTWVVFKENLEGMRRLVHASGLKDLLRPGQIWIFNSIDVYLASLSNKAAEINPNLEEAAKDTGQKNKLDALLADSRDLVLLYNDDLGGNLGLTAGFSFSDGD
ncbi:imelysin family protein [Rhizobium oryzicola]|uniref:Imelysin family protein n=1 Tax=Rhizobium oryzicola TaxID=1232668 RepID=A0ABT8SQJ2_9HYPH|nr:imelysin family protein [Rhizobium oryzicola]MDO1580735.1 imelysin family protein [Rhizobium oryzicola]